MVEEDQEHLMRQLQGRTWLQPQERVVLDGYISGVVYSFLKGLKAYLKAEDGKQTAAIYDAWDIYLMEIPLAPFDDD